MRFKRSSCPSRRVCHSAGVAKRPRRMRRLPPPNRVARLLTASSKQPWSRLAVTFLGVPPSTYPPHRLRCERAPTVALCIPVSRFRAPRSTASTGAKDGFGKNHRSRVPKPRPGAVAGVPGGADSGQRSLVLPAPRRPLPPSADLRASKDTYSARCLVVWCGSTSTSVCAETR